MTYFHNKSELDSFPKTEVEFFNLIKDDVDVVFDIGSRDDIDYIKNSYDKSREFHLFEPVQEFLSNCQEQIENLNPSDKIENKIFLNPYGIGSEEGTMSYYSNTQSFVFRTHNATSIDSGMSFEIKTLDGHCTENSVDSIDFLKIDIEGTENDIFQNISGSLRNVQNIFVEYHSHKDKPQYLQLILENLTKNDLITILTEVKNNLIEQYKWLFDQDGVELEFDQESLELIANKAYKSKAGARGLQTELERILLPHMFDLPRYKKANILNVTINKTQVNTPMTLLKENE